jgi:hypothetical protein
MDAFRLASQGGDNQQGAVAKPLASNVFANL